MSNATDTRPGMRDEAIGPSSIMTENVDEGVAITLDSNLQERFRTLQEILPQPNVKDNEELIANIRQIFLRDFRDSPPDPEPTIVLNKNNLTLMLNVVVEMAVILNKISGDKLIESDGEGGLRPILELDIAKTIYEIISNDYFKEKIFALKEKFNLSERFVEKYNDMVIKTFIAVVPAYNLAKLELLDRNWPSKSEDKKELHEKPTLSDIKNTLAEAAKSLEDLMKWGKQAYATLSSEIKAHLDEYKSTDRRAMWYLVCQNRAVELEKEIAVIQSRLSDFEFKEVWEGALKYQDKDVVFANESALTGQAVERLIGQAIAKSVGLKQMIAKPLISAKEYKKIEASAKVELERVTNIAKIAGAKLTAADYAKLQTAIDDIQQGLYARPVKEIWVKVRHLNKAQQENVLQEIVSGLLKIEPDVTTVVDEKTVGIVVATGPVKALIKFVNNELAKDLKEKLITEKELAKYNLTPGHKVNLRTLTQVQDDLAAAQNILQIVNKFTKYASYIQQLEETIQKVTDLLYVREIWDKVRNLSSQASAQQSIDVGVGLEKPRENLVSTLINFVTQELSKYLHPSEKTFEQAERDIISAQNIVKIVKAFNGSVYDVTPLEQIIKRIDKDLNKLDLWREAQNLVATDQVAEKNEKYFARELRIKCNNYDYQPSYNEFLEFTKDKANTEGRDDSLVAKTAMFISKIYSKTSFGPECDEINTILQQSLIKFIVWEEAWQEGEKSEGYSRDDVREFADMLRNSYQDKNDHEDFIRLVTYKLNKQGNDSRVVKTATFIFNVYVGELKLFDSAVCMKHIL